MSGMKIGYARVSTAEQDLASQREGLTALGIAPDKVDHVIATHMHWDHAGTHDLFPNARYIYISRSPLKVFPSTVKLCRAL